MLLCGVKSQMSTSHHPQTDGASEVMNRMVENFLQCYCSYRQDDWDALLPAAEFAYNSAVSTDLGCSPFEMDLGWCPRNALDMFRKPESNNETVNYFKARLKGALEDTRFSHQVAKARQSAYSAQKFDVPKYVVGDRVWLHKTLFRDAIDKSQKSDKLGAKRFGPFEITAKIGKNAVKVALPDNIRIHDVVHVAHTMPFVQQPADIGHPVVRPDPVPEPNTGAPLYMVEESLGHRKRGRGFQWLTLMEGTPRHEACWQPTKDFIDSDGTLTKAFHVYIVRKGLLPHLH